VTAPQPADPPLTDGVCDAWVQPKELPVEVQELHVLGTWCSILGFASDILFGASGRRWRNKSLTETVTLDPPDPDCGPVLWPAADYRFGYGWPILTRPGQPHRVRLPRPDVTAVSSVVLDGTAFTAWRLDGNWLVRTDHRGWPLSTTTLITYAYGRPVPPGGRLAAIALGTELGKAFAGKACALPSRVTSVTRQGVSFTALESLAILKDDLVGIHSVDLWLQRVNPGKVTTGGSVWSPDVVEARRA
jgi:hypothetical protein